MHPQDNCSWVFNYSLGPLDAKQGRPQKLTCLGYVKMMVSMASHNGFEDEGVPTKLLVSQLLLFLDYYTKYQIKA